MKEARRAARPAWTSLLARSARLLALSLGMPELASRSAFSFSRSARSKRVAWARAYSSMVEAARELNAGSGAGALSAGGRARPASLPRARLMAPGKERGLMAPKGCKLPSLMSHIINRRAIFVVILLSSLLLYGCSGEDPSEQADQAIKNANEHISEHNRLFDEARSTYTQAKQRIESGDDPSQQKDSITEAKRTLEEARQQLEDAQESLSTVDDLDVDPAVKEYANLLSDAMDAQLAAEAKEIQFYGILEGDPALENNRERAVDLLSEVGAGYREAEEAYAKAQELADSNPNLIEAPAG